MLRSPKLCGPHAAASDLRQLFVDDHIHAALVVDDGRLITVVERSDLRSVPADRAAVELGRLDGRTVRANENLESVRQRMRASQIRRLAVVDEQMNLLGLLCRKSTGFGFCSDSGVAARAAEREASAWHMREDVL